MKPRSADCGEADNRGNNSDKKDEKELYLADQHACVPLQPVGLIYTATVLNSVVKRFAEISPGLDGGQTDFDSWANSQDWTSLDSPHR